jgi:hypothetical protein
MGQLEVGNTALHCPLSSTLQVKGSKRIINSQSHKNQATLCSWHRSRFLFGGFGLIELVE